MVMTRTPEILTPEAPTPVNYAKRIYTVIIAVITVALLFVAFAMVQGSKADSKAMGQCLGKQSEYRAGLATSSQVALACR
jgi:hypothetical protein